MNKNNQGMKMHQLLSGSQEIELKKGSAILSCPNCNKAILYASMKGDIIQYKYEQLLAEDGDGIEPSYDNAPDKNGLIHLDGEILSGYCHSCNSPYYLFDMWISADKIFAYDGTPSWHLPEENDLTAQSPEQMLYQVTINGEQIGILEEFKNIPWKTSKGTLYVFESNLFSNPYNNEDDCVSFSFTEIVRELCTNAFIKIRKAMND